MVAAEAESHRRSLPSPIRGASALVHTDDVAWRHSFFGWSDLLIEGVLKPLLRLIGTDLRNPTIEERQAKLEELLKKAPPILRFSFSPILCCIFDVR
jgi:hypothetical protein